MPDLTPDTVLPLLRGRLGRPYRYVESCSSTQRLLTDDDLEGTTAVADAQTEGRGRLGRVWLAPPGRAILSRKHAFMVTSAHAHVAVPDCPFAQRKHAVGNRPARRGRARFPPPKATCPAAPPAPDRWSEPPRGAARAVTST